MIRRRGDWGMGGWGERASERARERGSDRETQRMGDLTFVDLTIG